MTIEKDRLRAKIAIRFIDLHGEQMWRDFGFYMGKRNNHFGTRGIAKRLGVTRKTIVYWIKKIACG